MPAKTLANTFLLILQGSALADLRGVVVDFRVSYYDTWSQLISVCNSERIINRTVFAKIMLK